MFITSIYSFSNLHNCKYFTQTLRIRTYSLWTVRSVECSCMCTQWQLQMGQILRRGQKKIIFRCTLLSWQRFAHVSANTWFRQLFFNEQCCFTVQVFVNGFGLKWDADPERFELKVWKISKLLIFGHFWPLYSNHLFPLVKKYPKLTRNVSLWYFMHKYGIAECGLIPTLTSLVTSQTSIDIQKH